MEPWDYLPQVWRDAVKSLTADRLQTLEEVRFRLARPVLCYGPDWFEALKPEGFDKELSRGELDSIVSMIAEHSLYARVEEMRQAFLTLPGGHRVGIAGRAVWSGGEMVSVTDITGLNFRRAQDLPMCAQPLLAAMAAQGISPRSLLLASPPRCGKTTLLRDLARHFSRAGERVTVIDERSEIAGMHLGHYGFDMGAHTDVLDGWSKTAGMMAAIRTLGPDRLIVDELGESQEISAIVRASNAGVAVACSIHAESFQQLREIFVADRGALTWDNLFETVVILSRRLGPGTFEEIWHRGKLSWARA